MILQAKSGQFTMLITCPHCKFSSRYAVSFIEDAIHDGKPIVCVACDGVFEIKPVGLTRAAELQRAPVQSEQNEPLFWGCSNCGAGNSVVNSICAECKAPRSNRSAVE